MKNLLLPFAVLIAACNFSCQSGRTSASDPLLMKVEDEPVHLSEFKYVYEKNNSSSDNFYTSQSLEEYIRLYTNFKLKVKEAEALGYDTAESFISELEGYRKQLAKPYLSEKAVTDQLVREAYDRLKKEIKVSHILISTAPDALPEDTIKAYLKAEKIRNRIMKGEDFASLATELSDDPSAKSNSGSLGYITALKTVYPFENAVYSLKENEISYPVRTKFGYHIIKVHDIRPSQGASKVAHIMTLYRDGMSPEDSVAAKEKIDEIHSKLQAGEDWNKIVQQFSEHVRSKEQNGEIGWITTGSTPTPSFEEAAFRLESPGDISEPVQTGYGWHIIKLLEKKPLDPFEELEPKIRSQVNRSRSHVNKEKLIKRLKEENQFEEYKIPVNKAIASISDSSVLNTGWKPSEDLNKNPVLFTMMDEKYTAGDFYSYLERKNPEGNQSPEYFVRETYNEFVEESIINFEERHLGDKYLDYRYLLNEYRDGILLFQLMDEKVWSKAMENEEGLTHFFETHREDYRWGERAEAIIFDVADNATLEKLKNSLSRDFYSAQELSPEPVYFESETLSDNNKKKIKNLSGFLDQKPELFVELNYAGKEIKDTTAAQQKLELISKTLEEAGTDKSRIIVNSTPSVTDTLPFVGMKFLTTSAEPLERSFNKENPLALEVTEGVFVKGENQILDQVSWKSDTSFIEKEDRKYMVIIKDLIEPQNKELNECRGKVISDYQEYLEESWIKQLRNKYTVEINEEQFQKLINGKKVEQ